MRLIVTSLVVVALAGCSSSTGDSTPEAASPTVVAATIPRTTVRPSVASPVLDALGVAGSTTSANVKMLIEDCLAATDPDLLGAVTGWDLSDAISRASTTCANAGDLLNIAAGSPGISMKQNLALSNVEVAITDLQLAVTSAGLKSFDAEAARALAAAVVAPRAALVRALEG